MKINEVDVNHEVCVSHLQLYTVFAVRSIPNLFLNRGIRRYIVISQSESRYLYFINEWRNSYMLHVSVNDMFIDLHVYSFTT